MDKITLIDDDDKITAVVLDASEDGCAVILEPGEDGALTRRPEKEDKKQKKTNRE